MSNRSLKNMLSFIVWLAILGLAIFLPKLFNYEWWSYLTSFLPFAVRLAYEYFDSIKLFINRLMLWTSSKEISWEMKTHFVGSYKKADIERIVKAITSRQNSTRILSKSEDGEVVISIQDLAMVIKLMLAKVRSDETEFTQELVFHVQRMVVPFRFGTETLNKLINLFADIRQSLGAEKEYYDFTALFTDENPYLGLFLRRLKLPEPVLLNVEYKEVIGANKATVSVTKTKIKIHVGDLQSLQSFTKKYITLSSLNLSGE